MKKNKTALITGITGQDGSYLADFLLSKGYNVIGIKRRNSLISTDRIDHILNDENKILNFTLVYGNMNDSGCLHRLLMEHNPDEIYNLAAQSHVRVSFDTPEETTKHNENHLLGKCYSLSFSVADLNNGQYKQNRSTGLCNADGFAKCK